MINNSQKAYIAGVIDSDGHISFNDTNRNFTIDVGVTNTSEELMNWLQSVIGGSVSVQRGKCADGCSIDAPGHIHKRQAIMKWHVYGERAAILLRGISPFLIVKSTTAEKVLLAWEDSLNHMQRPQRRIHHMCKERTAMSLMGWD